MNLRSITESRAWAWLMNSLNGKDASKVKPSDLLPFEIEDTQDQPSLSGMSKETRRVFASLIRENKLSPYVLGLAVTVEPQISRDF